MFIFSPLQPRSYKGRNPGLGGVRVGRDPLLPNGFSGCLLPLAHHTPDLRVALGAPQGASPALPMRLRTHSHCLTNSSHPLGTGDALSSSGRCSHRKCSHLLSKHHGGHTSVLLGPTACLWVTGNIYSPFTPQTLRGRQVPKPHLVLARYQFSRVRSQSPRNPNHGGHGPGSLDGTSTASFTGLEMKDRCAPPSSSGQEGSRRDSQHINSSL